MKDFIVSPRANADLNEIWTYLAMQTSTSTADRVLDEIYEVFARVERQPEIGSRVGDRSPGLRFVLAGKYVVFYENQTQLPRIRRVIHGTRDLSEYFGIEDESL